MMPNLRGFIRLAIFGLALGLGAIIILATAWLPIQIKGVRLAAWPITALGRFFVWLFAIRFNCAETKKFHQHHGFVFPNHQSFLDIILLVHIIPMRFLAKAEVRRWPFIGWIASGVNTVYVDRQDKRSRESGTYAFDAPSVVSWSSY